MNDVNSQLNQDNTELNPVVIMPTIDDDIPLPKNATEALPELTPAEELQTLSDDKNNLSDLLENSTNNYAKYYSLKEKYQAWQQWYDSQKKIWESLK